MANRKQLLRNQAFQNLQNPGYYFGEDVKMTLFPNDQTGEFWVHDTKHKAGMCIEVKAGRAGLSVRVKNFLGGLPMTICGETPQDVQDDITITQYYPDRVSQAFKQWYNCPHVPYHYRITDEGKRAHELGRQAAAGYAAITTDANWDPNPYTLCPYDWEEQPNQFNTYVRGFWEQLAHPNVEQNDDR